MELSIDSLKGMGAFTSAPVEKEIRWVRGDDEFTATVFVRPLSYRSAVSDIAAHANNGDAVAGRIASCICDKDGAPVFSAADITGEADPERGPLDHSLTMALLSVIGEVSGMGKSQPASSPKSKSSGTNSSSPGSAGKP